MASKKPTKANALRTAIMLQGVLAILFGIAAVFWPGLTTLTLIYLFAAFLLVDGVLTLTLGIAHIKSGKRTIFTFALALVEIGLGLFLISEPRVAFATFILILGLALIARGLVAFVHAFSGPGSSTTKAMHAILGVLGVVIGCFVLVQPVAGGLAFVWILGLYALVAGIVLVVLSSDDKKR